MKVYVKVNRLEAIKRGSEKWGSTIADLPLDKLTIEQRGILASLPTKWDGGDIIILNDDDMPEVSEATVEHIAAIIDQVPAILVMRQAKKEAERQEKHNKLVEKVRGWTQTEDGYHLRNHLATDELKSLPAELQEQIQQVLDKIKRVEAEKAANLQRANEEEARKKAEEVRKQKELEERKKEHLIQLLQEHGNDNQKERFAAGVLDLEGEILQQRKEALFEPLNEWPLYQKATHNQLCVGECYCEGCKVTRSNYSSGFNISAKQWDKAGAIREIIKQTQPDSIVEFAEHDASVDCCAGAAETVVVRVTIKEGPFGLTREYDISQE